MGWFTRFRAGRGTLPSTAKWAWFLTWVIWAAAVATLYGTPAFASVFSPDGCEFQVRFPGEPTIENLIVRADLEPIPEATFYGDDYFLRANCITQPTPIFFEKDQLLAELERYASMNGLTRVYYNHKVIDLGIVARARGYKEIDEIWVTYETVWYIGEESTFTIAFGGRSATYPPEEILEFEQSVSLKR